MATREGNQLRMLKQKQYNTLLTLIKSYSILPEGKGINIKSVNENVQVSS
jgi:hypothetical protein